MRGAEVMLACAAEYESKVTTAGLAFRPVGPSFADMENALGMDRAELTQAVLKRSDFLFRRLIVPHVRQSYDDMLPLIEGADMVLTSSLAFGARLAAERLSVRWIGVVLQPLMFLSAFDAPVIPDAEWLSALCRGLGPAFTRFVLHIMKHAVGGLLGPVRELRQQIGLGRTARNPLFEGQFSADGAIGLYSKVLGDMRPDFPNPTSIVGFAGFDSEDGSVARLEPDLRAFLDSGSPPLVFTLGSLVVHSPGSFYRESFAAARTLGRRAVLLVGEKAVLEYANLRCTDVFVAAYAPHSLLFSRSLATVHQGGIGTLSQALRSGQPQLIVPFFADQLDNAARAVKLGVARALAPRRYDAAAAVRELAPLIEREEVRARARTVRKLLLAEDGAAEGAVVVLNRLESSHS
jgi:UDP:flavonoid glycosyltransferase YjiC (YdhE family)